MLNYAMSTARRAINACRKKLSLERPPKRLVGDKLAARITIKRLPQSKGSQNGSPRYEVTAVYNGKTITKVADASRVAGRYIQHSNGRELQPKYRLAEVWVRKHDFITEFARHQPYPHVQVCLEFVFKPIGEDARSLFGVNQLFSFEKSVTPATL